MKKKAIVILGLLAVVLSGCGGETQTGIGTPFLGGTNGLLIGFMEDAPPVEVYDGGGYVFQIVAKISNEGEWAVPEGKAKVKISGIDPSLFGTTSENLNSANGEPLEASYKDSEGNEIEGTTTLVEFSDLNFVGDIQGNMQFPIRMDVCYSYGTRAVSNLCIKEDLHDTGDAVCSVTSEKVVYSSRAPIQVVDLRENVRSTTEGQEKVGFTFTIKNMGNGDFFAVDSNCDTTGITNENKVHVTVTEGADCSGLDGNSGTVTLYGGERSITCTFPAVTTTDYLKPIDLTITYDYRENRETQLLVKHTGG